MALLPVKANTPENNETMDDRSPIPAGTYLAHVVKSEMKATKAKNGHYLSLQYKILQGRHKGRVVFSNLNLDNPNPIAVEIATKELNSLCTAINMQGVEDSVDLHEKPLGITLKIKPGDGKYAPSNEIAAYVTEDKVPEEGEAPQTGGDKAPPWEE